MSDNPLAIPSSFALTPTGLQVLGEPSFEEWRECGVKLKAAEKAVQWAIGDWLNYGEKRYGEKYKEAAELTGLSYGALRNIKSVAANIELSRRRDNLPFSTHVEVAALPVEQADAVLEEAEEKRLSKVAVRERVRAVREAAPLPPVDEPTNTTAKLDALVARGLKFGTIYADPPWAYSNQATRAATSNHYDTMTIEALCALPVGDLAAERSHLWLWTTNAFLFECPRLFEAWGFEFKSSYVWVKPQMGIGNYLRNSHELLLLATRGGLTAAARDVMSWGQFDRTKHSAKPEAIRTHVVERLSPGPRLELFGRKAVDGWTVFGNQIAPADSLFATEPQHITGDAA